MGRSDRGAQEETEHPKQFIITMSKWGNLSSRYEVKKQRKILAIDGGGIRGILALEILKIMETQLQEAVGKGDKFCLADYFDYIGGTSTGAIIATGLSKGMRVDELLSFYQESGKAMFQKSYWLAKLSRLYNKGPLVNKLIDTFGEGDIDLLNGTFKSLLLIVTMNRTTNSPWPISNNPFARYNDSMRPDCNLRIPLYQLIRASTAAPGFFAPEELHWDKSDEKKRFSFVDGGVTPYNNPAFLMYRMATQGHYGLNWERGEKNLLVASVGTGSTSIGGSYYNIANTLINIPSHLMYCMQVDQDINCRTAGKCVFGAEIDREVGNMISGEDNRPTGNVPLSDKHFTYARYNADLSQDGLSEMKLGHIKSRHVSAMDSTKYISELRQIGKLTGEAQIDVKLHFSEFLT